jgi:hypothetical protein
MSLAERLPSMTDKELVSLANNAQRLTASTNTIQREAAEAVIPQIQAEQAIRQANKPAPKRKPLVKAAAKPKVTKAEAEEAAEA